MSSALALDDYLDALLGGDVPASAQEVATPSFPPPASPTEIRASVETDEERALRLVAELGAEFDAEFGTPAEAVVEACAVAETVASVPVETQTTPAVPLPATPTPTATKAELAAATETPVAPSIAKAAALPAAALPEPVKYSQTTPMPSPFIPQSLQPAVIQSPLLLPQTGQLPYGTERRRSSEPTTRWLRMRCDEQHYALELLKVQEVVLPATLLPLRGGARHLLGVMNLRGQVVPVIDLGLFLGRAAIEPDMLTRIVVLEENGEILGLRVSAVEDVTNIAEPSIEPPDNTRVCRITNHLFRGVARLGSKAVILLDASQLLK